MAGPSRLGRLALEGQRFVKDALCRAVAVRVDFDPAQNLYVFSDPRGGSTWLTEAISEVPGTAIIWEPLHKGKVRAWDRVDFEWRPSLSYDEEREDVRRVFEKVFRGKALNEWMRGASHAEYLRAERLLIKVSRGNALLPWLTRQFDFAFAPVLFVRHPFAVVASQLAWGAWDFRFEGATLDFPSTKSVGGVSRQIETKEEFLVAKWCQTTHNAMCHPRNDLDWITIHYEHLLLNPSQEIGRLFERWGLDVPPGILERLAGASVTTKEATFEQGTQAQLSKWREQLTDDQVVRMQAVLDGFGVTEYGQGLLPRWP